jgi:hypothetical protein
MPLGLVIIGFGSICRDGFLFGGRIPQSCAAGCSVRVQTSGPRWDTSGGLRLGSGQITPRLAPRHDRAPQQRHDPHQMRHVRTTLRSSAGQVAPLGGVCLTMAHQSRSERPEKQDDLVHLPQHVARLVQDGPNAEWDSNPA